MGITGKNNARNPISVALRHEVTDSQGVQLNDGNQSLNVNSLWKTIPAQQTLNRSDKLTLSNSAVGGTYTYKGIIIYNEKEYSKTVTFVVAGIGTGTPPGGTRTTPTDQEIKQKQDDIIKALTPVCNNQSNKAACNEKVKTCVNSEAIVALLKIPRNLQDPDVEPYSNALKECQKQGIEAGKGTGTPPGPGTPPGSGTGTKADPSKMALSIHGWAEGTLSLKGFESLDWISVAASVLDSKGECINAYNNGAVKLTLTKDGKNIPVNTTSVWAGNQLGETHAFNRICWSYQAKLPAGEKKPGKYTLDAVYDGNSSYNPISASTTVTFTDKDLTVTKTEIKTQGVKQVKADNSKKTVTSKIALSKLLMKPAGNVAGAQAEMQDGQIKIVNDPASPDGTITLIPESSVGNGSCDAQNLPTVHFIVTKVGKAGGAEVIYDNTAYPNCEPWTKPLAELGDLSEISRIVATASLSEDPESSYQSSRDEIVITVSDSVGAAQPFVKLSSNPSPEHITSFDSRVTVTATTNREVASPVFKVSHNGEQRDVAADSSTGTCRDGISSCQYSVDIFQPEGDYEVVFVNGNASDSLNFNSKADKTAGEITGVGLLVGGEEVPLALNGSQLNLTLDGSPTNAFQLVIHYANGTEARKSLIINYGQPADWNCVYSQGGSCYKGYTTNLSTCTQVNGTCLNPTAGCEYRSGPVACPQGSAVSPTPIATPPSGVCKDEPGFGFKYNQCVACNTSQAVCQDGNGSWSTGPNQSDGGCSNNCSNPTPAPTGPDAGAPGKDCIYSQDGNCYSGKIGAQSSCPGMTTLTNVCINPSGGCQWGDGSHQVDCQTGEAI